MIPYETSRKAFEEHLNEGIQPAYESDEWIMGGRRRTLYMNRYGTCLRRHDKTAFEVIYQEWKREQEK